MEKEEKTKIVIPEENPSGIRGELTLDGDVVKTIAHLAAKDIMGVHSIGKAPLIPLSNSVTRGVGAEIGASQAALDLDIIVEYGHDIKKLAKELRERVSDAIAKMAGREVVEININIVDIKLPEKEKEKKNRPSRVS